MALLYGYRRMLAVIGIAFFIYLLSPWGGGSGRTIGDLTGFGNKSPPLTLDDLPKLEHNAHRLADADDFLPHFKAVAMLPGMPIAESKSGCNWFDEKSINFQFEDKEWMRKDREDAELEERRFQWHHFLDQEMKPWSKYKSKFEGRGIVIVAGHKGSMDRVGVILRSLFKLGSQLPVEIHSFKGEIDKETKKNLTAMWPHMYFNDLSSKSAVIKTNLDNMFHVNYQLKTAAIVNSRFAEPLLLDSDNIPVVDPLTLYDTAEYREYGTLFWPDIARTRPNNPMWAITNTKCRMNEYEQESGQLIVDKRKFWYHLQLAAWFNNKEGGYYNDFLLGDKDMFRFAWHALKTPYGSPKKWFIPVGTVKDGVFCGHTFAQNHPDGRVAFMHGSLIKALTPPVIKYHKQHGGGIHQFFKRSLFDESHNVIEKAGVKWEDIKYIPDRDPKMENVWCIDFFNVTAQPMDELIPGFEKTFEDIGGYWMLDA